MDTTYIKRLPLRGLERLIDVDVVVGAGEAALVCQRTVQPGILAVSHKKFRLDARWDWPRLFYWYQHLERAKARTLSVLTIMTPSATTSRSVPLGQMMVSEGYPALDGSNHGSVFIWLLAGVPLEALQALGINYGHPNLVLEALIDTAIQRSYALGYGGRIGLHAAPAGGQRLLALYRDKGRVRRLTGSLS